MALAAALAVMLGIAATAHAQPYEVTVSSTAAGWTQTPLNLGQGAPFTVSYIRGEWTVDYRNYEPVGPQGHPPDIDSQIYQGCKLVNAPYATLLGKVGNGSVFVVGAGGNFTADASGPLYLRIHDDDRCLGDNQGSVVMKVDIGSACIYDPRTGGCKPQAG